MPRHNNAVLSTRASQQEGSGFEPGALSVCSGFLHSKAVQIRSTDYSEPPTCLNVCVTDWRPTQSEPHLSLDVS